MNTKQLRQKILDLAIKGKLVPQDPNDEPASKLLERIREEKEQLIKDGKLKRDKNESYIFVGDDKLHYEKFADGSVVCIEDEIPFEIPEFWAWCRLKNICNYIQRGKSPKYTEIEKYPVISQKCIRWTGLDMKPAKFITEDSLKKYEEVRFLRDNDILWNSTGTGTVGRATIYNSKLNPFDIAVADSHVTVLRPMFVESLYIYDFIMSPYIQIGFEDLCDGSTNQKELSLTTVSEFLIPLPPAAEQKRISETVETLLQLVETIDSDKIDLSNLIKQTKAKILDLAIKGKLVPQDPNDEPADKLLEKIREAKEKLIKEGKLKRDKNETFIFKNSDDNSYYEQIDGETICIDDDLPFEIPNSWRWCSLGNIGDWGAGSTPNRNKFEYYNNGTIPWLKTGDLNDSFIENIPEHITEQALKETSVSIKPKGSILIAMYGATIGKLGILNIDSTTNQACCACKCIKINNLYLFYYLMSQRNKLKEMGMGGAQPNISKEVLVNYYFTLPPIQEQNRIVEKIKSIFTQLDTIQEIFLQ